VPGLAFDAPGDALSAAAVGNRIVAVARRQSDRALFTGMFDDGGAPHWTRLPVEPSVSIPRMGRSAFGAPLLVWGVLKSGSYPAFPAFSVPLLLASGFALECAPGP
jgi:hypothetical protein